MTTIVELDKRVGTPAPAYTFSGYFITFDKEAPGPPYNFSWVYEIIDRGQLVAAGRVAAWPLGRL